MIEIIVINERNVSKFLGFKVKKAENLTENSKCQNFITENKEYFVSTKKEDFIIFFKKTGIRLQRETILYNMRFNFLGMKIEEFCNIYDCDLLVIDRDHDYKVKNNILYINEKEVRNIESETKKQKERAKRFEQISEHLMDVVNNPHFYDDFEKEKERLVYKYYPEYEIIKDTKQIVISPYSDIFALTEDGTLYINDEVYARDVEYIFEQDSINKIIIYKNQTIEYLTSKYPELKSDIQYDKILYSKTSLITLVDKKVTIIAKEYDEYIREKSATIELKGIDDIEYKDNDEIELILKIGKEEVLIDLYSLTSN